jgi:hypothetical protein
VSSARLLPLLRLDVRLDERWRSALLLLDAFVLRESQLKELDPSSQFVPLSDHCAIALAK